jgi:diguanylate cyclase (GGDEF)-like protein
MWLLATAYVAALALHGAGWGPAMGAWFDTTVNGWLGLLTLWMPMAVCWLAVYRVGLRRPEVLLSAAAVTSYAAGDTYYVLKTVGGGSLPFPSLADVGYLAFYPLMLAALVVAVRPHVRGLTSSVWLDSAVGSLGATSVLAVLLSPVLTSAAVGPHTLAKAIAVANPLFDLLLVAAVAGVAALGDVRMGRWWGLLAAGLLLFAATDVVYGLQATAGTYLIGTPLDAGWAMGLALMALWVDRAAQREKAMAQQARPATGATALAVSTAATVAGTAVLVMGARSSLSALAVTLAGVTLLAATARAQLAFRRLARMADQRRLAAATDELTGLPNRRALYAEGQQRLVEPLRQRQALLMLDLDKFKEVNDSLGHRAGDQLLVQVGSRLGQHLRAGDVLARLGGDEFAVLLDDVGRDEAVEVAIKLGEAVDEPFALDDIALHSGVSIGIALFPADGPDLSTLLRKADIAMYKAKTLLTGHHVYCIADDADDVSRLQTVEELRTALKSGQLVLHYQPKIDLATGEVHSVEALVRWDHPTRGLLYPDAFLSLVEESGLMPALTRVVLALALDQVADWHARGQQLTVAVNLSASAMVDSDLPRQVTSMLAARGVSPEALQLEITEEFLMADHDRARSILDRLRRSGVQISVDDFGSGYSSLGYLRDLPIDELKLDRSFILPMTQDDRTAALVASTIGLAHGLGLRMVAEGVESDVAYTRLTHLGCDQAQGYFMSRPVPAADLDDWLSSRRRPDQSTELPKARTAKTPG